jgi:hypothetical protein
MTQASIDYAKSVITSIGIRHQATFKPETVDHWARELEHLSIEEIKTAFKRFKAEYESLPYQFAVSAGLLKQLKPTVTTATIEERLFSALRDKEPRIFLRSISPKLLELADQGGLFDRSISATDQGFRVRDIAKRFLEWQQNNAKGFTQPEPEADLKKLEFTPAQMQRIQNPFKGLPISEAAKLAAEELAKKKEGRTDAV